MAAPNIEGTSNVDVISGGGANGFGAAFAGYTTANRPPYAKGVIYFDLTTNKLVVGGATAYETITSS
jgi:hypothetical protein